MNEESTTNKATKGGAKIKNQQGVYSQFEPLVEPSLERLKQLLNSRNDGIALGAIKVILNKVIPDKKAVELTGQDGGPIKLNIIAGADYFAWRTKVDAASGTGSVSTTSTLQDASVASESTQDDNSNNATDKLEST